LLFAGGLLGGFVAGQQWWPTGIVLPDQVIHSNANILSVWCIYLAQQAQTESIDRPSPVCDISIAVY
jgi:hypothetical protein